MWLRITGNRQQSGDTIVEVLLAMAVLGSVLVGGYSIATRSLNGVRVSQERSEALKVAEAQIENLKARDAAIRSGTGNPRDILVVEPGNSPIDPRNFTDASTGYCFDDSGVIQRKTITNQEDLQDPEWTGDDEGRPDCIKSNNRYYTLITNQYREIDDRPDAVEVIYTVSVQWERAGGGEQQTLNLYYKTILEVAATGP